MEVEPKIIDMSSLTTPELLTRAEAYFEEMLYDKSKAFYQEAYKNDPDNEDLLCSYANFLTTIGEIAPARKLLRHALELNIEKSSNYKKFVQMAELVDGKLSVQLYEKAIEILHKLYNPIVDSDPVQMEIKRDLSQAYSALAEIYQTDLLQYKESEGLCQENIEQALKIDNLCLDAFLQYANFYLNKEDIDQAKKWLKKLMEEIRREESEDLDKEGDIEEETKGEKEMEKGENPIDFYPISFKMNVSRALMEVEEFDDAIEMLEYYIEEDAENIEALYLLAFCNFKAKHYPRCAEVMEDLAKKDLTEDEEIIIAFKELQHEMSFVNVNEGEEPQEEAKEGDDGDWMDVE